MDILQAVLPQLKWAPVPSSSGADEPPRPVQSCSISLGGQDPLPQREALTELFLVDKGEGQESRHKNKQLVGKCQSRFSLHGGTWILLYTLDSYGDKY